MEFHVWDFSDRIEVRPTNEFVEKLKTVTKPVTVVSSRFGRKFTFVRHFWLFPEKKPIGKRLFATKDQHRGKVKPHEPYVTIAQLLEVQRQTGISFEEIEQSIIRVRVCGSALSVSMTFPVATNVDWAFLMGLWFGAGGFITRFRKNAQEKGLRFAVDPRPYRELVKPLLLKLGYSDIELKTIYYAKAGGHHKLDAQKWRQYGSEPRGHFSLHRFIREIMEKFGLPDQRECKSKRKTKGGKSGFRQYSREIPTWIKDSTEYSHAFIEGYLNGQSTSSQFHVSYPHRPVNPLTRFVEPRFMGREDIVLPFYRWFAEFMANKEGIEGYEHHLPSKHSGQINIELGYLIINNLSLRKLFEQFRIMRSDTRARLMLHYYLNPLMYELCRKLECFETLLLGAILELPQSVEELTRDFRCSKNETLRILERLHKHFKAIKPQGSKWILQDGFKNVVLAELNAKEEERRHKIAWASTKFFSECNQCGDIVQGNHIEERPCRFADCKGKYQPISRTKAIQKQHLRNGQLTVRINKVRASKLPSFSLG